MGKNNNCKFCFEKTENCICIFDNCSVCGKERPVGEFYEYRGAIACEKCFEECKENREKDRQEVIEINRHKTECFKGIDTSNNTTLGKANRELLKKQIDIAKKEDGITKRYEGRD